jgi:hypothetical protein
VCWIQAGSPLENLDGTGLQAVAEDVDGALLKRGVEGGFIAQEGMGVEGKGAGNVRGQPADRSTNQHLVTDPCPGQMSLCSSVAIVWLFNAQARRDEAVVVENAEHGLGEALGGGAGWRLGTRGFGSIWTTATAAN